MVGGRRARLAGIGLLALLVAATVVGVAGRAALPGESLYAARHLVDRAGVVLTRTAQDRGVRLLDVAERHVGDAVTLGSRPESPAESMRTALADGLAAVDEGHEILVDDFRGRTDPGSLVALSRFADRVLPRAGQLDRTAGAEVRADVARFRSHVERLRTEALTLLAGCPTCGSAADDARGQLAALVADGPVTGVPSLVPSPAPSVTPTTAPGPAKSSAPAAGTPAAPGPTVTAPVAPPGGSPASSPAASPTSAATSNSPPPDGQVVTVPPLPVSPSLSPSLSLVALGQPPGAHPPAADVGVRARRLRLTPCPRRRPSGAA